MTARLLDHLDRFVFSAARHGTWLLVLLAIFSYQVETARPVLAYAVIAAADGDASPRAIVSADRGVGDSEQVVFGLQNESAIPLAPGRALGAAAPSERSIEGRAVRWFDARGSPDGIRA